MGYTLFTFMHEKHGYAACGLGGECNKQDRIEEASDRVM
jgi:hypothetical protein